MEVAFASALGEHEPRSAVTQTRRYRPGLTENPSGQLPDGQFAHGIGLVSLSEEE
jgi:hypothetical protein